MKAAFNKILNKKKKSKVLSTGPTLNQSMIDMIVNDTDPNESFRSAQLRPMRSPSVIVDEVPAVGTARLDTLFDSPNQIQIKSNISSVLNVPKKVSWLPFVLIKS